MVRTHVWMQKGYRGVDFLWSIGVGTGGGGGGGGGARGAMPLFHADTPTFDMCPTKTLSLGLSQAF